MIDFRAHLVVMVAVAIAFFALGASVVLLFPPSDFCEEIAP